MSKLIGISTGLKNVDMAPGNIPCVVINSDFVKACNKFKIKLIYIIKRRIHVYLNTELYNNICIQKKSNDFHLKTYFKYFH